MQEGLYRAPTIEEIREARKKRTVITMYTVFGDESHDSNEEQIYVVAGLLGVQEQWDDFEVKWKERTGGRIFRAADCESDWGDFRNSSHDENLALYKDLTHILADSDLFGYGAAIDINGYRNAFPDIMNGYSYLFCFRVVIERFADIARNAIEDRVKFNFHINSQIEYTAAAMYQIYRDNPELKYGQYLDEISYVPMNYVGIQVSDLFAREIMKWVERGASLDEHKNRKSLMLLAKTKRFKMDFFTDEYFQDYKKNFPAIKAVPGSSAREYQKWLSDEGIKHNASNSTRYLAHIYDMERKRRQLETN